MRAPNVKPTAFKETGRLFSSGPIQSQPLTPSPRIIPTIHGRNDSITDKISKGQNSSQHLWHDNGLNAVADSNEPDFTTGLYDCLEDPRDVGSEENAFRAASNQISGRFGHQKVDTAARIFGSSAKRKERPSRNFKEPLRNRSTSAKSTDLYSRMRSKPVTPLAALIEEDDEDIESLQSMSAIKDPNSELLEHSRYQPPAIASEDVPYDRKAGDNWWDQPLDPNFSMAAQHEISDNESPRVPKKKLTRSKKAVVLPKLQKKKTPLLVKDSHFRAYSSSPMSNAFTRQKFEAKKVHGLKYQKASDSPSRFQRFAESKTGKTSRRLDFPDKSYATQPNDAEAAHRSVPYRYNNHLASASSSHPNRPQDNEVCLPQPHYQETTSNAFLTENERATGLWSSGSSSEKAPVEQDLDTDLNTHKSGVDDAMQVKGHSLCLEEMQDLKYHTGTSLVNKSNALQASMAHGSFAKEQAFASSSTVNPSANFPRQIAPSQAGSVQPAIGNLSTSRNYSRTGDDRVSSTRKAAHQPGSFSKAISSATEVFKPEEAGKIPQDKAENNEFNSVFDFLSWSWLYIV